MRSTLKFVVSAALLVIIISVAAAETDIIRVTESLRDGQTLVSSGGNFELGFFSPENSNKRYLGVWYKKVSLLTAVWVANRENPLADTSGVLQVTNQSKIVILNGTGHRIWSSNSNASLLKDPVAQLLDTGNLVIRDEEDENEESYTWQSFDHPCDTHLPGMKLGWDLVTGRERYLSSWTSSDDPSPGNYTYMLDIQGYPQLVLMKGHTEQYRSGPWNGVRFSGIPGMKPINPVYRYWFVFNQSEASYNYRLLNDSVISRRVLNPYGMMQRVIWNEHSQGWVMYLTAQSDSCDNYGLCGAFGSCNIGKSPQCGCLEGFVPKAQVAWDSGDWSDGCVRHAPLACESGDGFIKYSNVKLPDTKISRFNVSMSLTECENMCLKNCSCTAYSNLDIRAGGSGCLLWFGDLVDVREYTTEGQDLFIRLLSSEIGRLESAKKKRKWILVSSILLSAAVLVGLALYAKKTKKLKKMHGYDMKETGVSFLNFTSLAQATDNFSDEQKLGEGGFGAVYKGTLQGGQEIAVKRLSKESSQGVDEFKNEVRCIAKLQHRNLVKLIGCCIQAEERLLVYEYMANRSLDSFLFEQGTSLDWPKRFHIITGIARGLLYLHQDSRLRIVHRDLKASNVLLDRDLNPKISDFGTARSFLGNDTQAKTKRIIGTYGYMSPEYAVDGLFSVKSDVFSFGVLLLEIISGTRNRGFIYPDHHHNLLGHAWRLFGAGESLKLVDPSLDNPNDVSQILRSIQVGLLCVQQRPKDRPTMSTVVVMISSEGELPEPKEPGFFLARNFIDMDSDSGRPEPRSTNEISISMLVAR